MKRKHKCRYCGGELSDDFEPNYHLECALIILEKKGLLEFEK